MPKGPKLVDGRLIRPPSLSSRNGDGRVNGNGRDYSHRLEQLAVNLDDLKSIDPLVRAQILGGKLNNESPVLVDCNADRVYQVGATFICDLRTAALCCDLLRSENRKASTPPIRVYLKRDRGSWARVPRTHLLTVLKYGKSILNPEIFREEVKASSLSIPTPKVFTIDEDEEQQEEEW